MRIAAKAVNTQAAQDIITPVESEVRGLLGRHVFAVDDQTIEDVVGDLLHSKGLTIAAYEDLTGGMTAERLQQASRGALRGMYHRQRCGIHPTHSDLSR